MDLAVKQRIIGVAVLTALAFIFLPMLVGNTEPEQASIETVEIPDMPESFKSRVQAIEPLPITDFTEVDDENSMPVELPPMHETEIETPTAIENPNSQAAANVEPPAKALFPKENKASTLKANKPKPPKRAKAKTRKDTTKFTPSLGSPNGWVIQVGSFNNKSNAERLQNKLSNKGFPAFVESASGGSRKVFRVRVGPEQDRKRLEEMRQVLGRALNLKGIIVRN